MIDRKYAIEFFQFWGFVAGLIGGSLAVGYLLVAGAVAVVDGYFPRRQADPVSVVSQPPASTPPAEQADPNFGLRCHDLVIEAPASLVRCPDPEQVIDPGHPPDQYVCRCKR